VFLIEIKEFKEFEERSQNPESRSQEVHGAIHVWRGAALTLAQDLTVFRPGTCCDWET
jgi:hypothetical protein